MKTIIASFCFLTCALPQLRAQQNDTQIANDRWQFSVSGGVAIPVGKFAERNVWDSTAAFAKTGPLIELTAAYRFFAHWSALLLVNGQENGVNTNSVVAQMHQADPSELDAYAYKSGKWQLGRVMGGVSYDFPLGAKHRFFLTGRMLLGAVMVNTPRRSIFEFSADSAGNAFSESEGTIYKKASKWQFAYQVGFGIQYYFMHRLVITAGADYAGSMVQMPTLPMILASPSHPPGPVQVIAVSGPPPPMNYVPHPSYTQPLATVNAGLGLGIRI